MVDGHAMGYHEHDADGMSAGDELDEALESLAKWYKMFPKADVLLGNHDRLAMRKAFTGGIPRRWMTAIQDVLNVPTWNFKERFVYDNVQYIHGEGGTARVRCKKDLMSTVQGHLHTQSYTEHFVGQNYHIFGSQVGCVDKDTEYLSPDGWKRISEYDGGLVAQANADGTANFVKPDRYIVRNDSELLHFKNHYGLEMKLTKDHSVAYYPRDKKRILKRPASEVAEMQEKNVNGFENEIPVAFHIENDTSLPLTDAELRLQVAFHADGSIIHNKVLDSRGIVTVRKKRKIERMRALLNESGIHFIEKVYVDSTRFNFKPPILSKRYDSSWYKASYKQLQIIANESLLWDGDQKTRFTSKHKQDVDFIQYAFASTGHRTSIRLDNRDGKPCYDMTISKKRSGRFIGKKGGSTVPVIKTEDGKSYCFTVPSGMLVLRCNDSVFITGNCGVDRKSYAMAYAKEHPKPSIAVMVIANHGTLPINILMPL